MGDKWYATHKREKYDYTQRYLNEVRIVVLSHYGNGKLACVQCGESRLPCLTIDHVNNAGNQDRKIRKLYGTNFYKMLKRTNFPLGYQTLCMNCQFVKAHDYHKFNGRMFKKGNPNWGKEQP